MQEQFQDHVLQLYGFGAAPLTVKSCCETAECTLESLAASELTAVEDVGWFRTQQDDLRDEFVCVPETLDYMEEDILFDCDGL